jgi:hypothetical protein
VLIARLDTNAEISSNYDFLIMLLELYPVEESDEVGGDSGRAKSTRSSKKYDHQDVCSVA